MPEDGSVLVWGTGNEGLLANGSCEPRGFEAACAPVPRTVEGFAGVARLSMGVSHALALLRDGTVMAWRRNKEGQLGDGTPRGWGEGYWSSLGNGSYGGIFPRLQTPRELGPLLTHFVAARRAFAIRPDGTVMGWGPLDMMTLEGRTRFSTTPVPVFRIGKGAIDLVTEADLASERYLLGEIQQRFPDDIIISEEKGSLAGEQCSQWFIDPLDGTINFAHRLQIFSVSIAFCKTAACCTVWSTIQCAMNYSAHNKGWVPRCSGKPICVSGQAELDRSLLVTGLSYDIRTNPINNLDLFEKFSKRTQGVRRLGSSALDLCYVASGRLDGFWEPAIQSWDIAAGSLIAREAGATVTKTNGSAELLAAPCSVLAANPPLHQQMLAVLQDNS